VKTGQRSMDSPLGSLWLRADTSGWLTDLRIGEEPEIEARCVGEDDPSPDAARMLDAAATQLDEYFECRRVSFDIPLAIKGSAFQRQVWAELLKIPYGTTVSYSHLAVEIGRTGAARAVGHANARNPIAIIVPCHRVIGSSGLLTGYGGGLRAKQHLLDLEARGPRRSSRRISPRVAP
jgi:methylated-DNA-[protein]-cysteine S-methyltransferase